MRRSIFNALAIAAGAVLVAALGVSAHSQISGAVNRSAVHIQTVTLHTAKGEVESEARDNEVEVPDQPETQPPAPETEAPDNDNEAGDNDDQGENEDQAPSTGGDTGDDGGGGD